MNEAFFTKVSLRLAIAVAVFNALSGIGGGIAMLLTDGLGMPKTFLDHSPFSSFLPPALILLVVVGGTQAVAAVQLIFKASSSLLWNATAGFGMIVWITVELMMVQQFTWLQILYFGTGIAQLALTFTLLGIIPGLPHPVLVTRRHQEVPS